MTNENEATKSKLPTREAFHVVNREGKKGFWTRAGSIWPNQDGSETLQFHLIPLDGRLILRDIAKEPKA